MDQEKDSLSLSKKTPGLDTCVAITGASGLVGKAVMRAFLQAGYSVIAVVRPGKACMQSVQPSLQWREADITNAQTLTQALKGATIVIHLAARKNDEVDTAAVNVGGAQHLVESCRKTGVQLIVNVSTQSAKLPKRGLYGQTKKEADAIIESSHIPSITLLSSVIYSDLKTGILGSIFAFTNLPIVPIVGTGTVAFEPLHVDDLALAIVQSIQTPQMYNKRFDVGGLQSISFNEMVQEILERRGMQKELFHLPMLLCFFLARVLLLLPRPPLTISNVLGATQHVAIDSKPFWQSINMQPRSLKNGMDTIFSVHAQEQETKEARALLSYVLSKAPDQVISEAMVDRYTHALQSNGISPDAHLDDLFLHHPQKISSLDAITRLRFPHSLLQKKLLIAVAIVECDPISANWLLPKNRSRSRNIVLCAAQTLSAVFAVVRGFILLLRPTFLTRNAGL